MPTFTYLAGSRHVLRRELGQSARDTFERITDHLLEQGSFALRQLERDDSAGSRRLQELLDAGYLRRTEDGGLAPSLSALQACEDRLLADLFRAAGGGTGWHDQGGSGSGPTPTEHTRPWRPGEPLDHLSVSGTLAASLARGLPLSVREEDVIVHQAESAGRCSTVLLVDLSGSMARHGKFVAARRAALALRALVRRRYPGDEFLTAGFATRAVALPGGALLDALPRNVGLFDPHENALRLDAEAVDVPEHFTNIQAGLRLARRHLNGQRNAGKQILLVTDGEPTAHLEGREIVLAYPTTEATLRHTLAEARRCAGEGIALSVFGLLGEFAAPELRPFVEKLARAGRGKAVVCPPSVLGRGLLAHFVHTRATTR